MLAGFRVACYRLTLQAGEQGLDLPPYKGSALRGGFGSVFRRITCTRGREECRECLLQPGCPYAYIFETAPPPASRALSKYEAVPRPFVLEPPPDTRTRYEPGEVLTFRLVLIGRAIDYLPYFLVTFQELGRVGIGQGRKPYRLARVEAVNPLTCAGAVIYDGSGRVLAADLAVTGEALMEECRRRGAYGSIQLDFQTMTRIKHEEQFARRIDFHILVRALLRRLSSLAYFHHGRELDLDFSDLIRRAGKVERTEDQTRWVDWERYSHRQKARMTLGGVVGRLTYRGEITPFLPLLKMGELVHVGKAATFGMGKYAICW